MQILKELEVLIPPLTSEEFKQLERNILEEGIRDPLVTWNGILVDGHNRYRIAQEYDIDYETVEKEFTDMNAVKEWMINNQFGRRNLPAYERGKLALRLKDIYSQKAKETKAEKVSHYRQTGEVLQISVKPDTQRDLAKVANVSHDTINKIEKIEAKATDEVKQKLSSGTMSINEAYKEIKKEEKKVERVELIQKQIEDIEEGLLPDLVGLFDVVSVDPPWPYEGDAADIIKIKEKLFYIPMKKESKVKIVAWYLRDMHYVGKIENTDLLKKIASYNTRSYPISQTQTIPF